MKKVICFVCLSMLLSGCMTAADHSRQLHSSNEREMTVGVVQREIRKGMTQADVAQALGSPNIVSRDNEGVEAWIYDKIATEVSYSKSNVSGGIGGLLIGGVGGAAGVVSGGRASGAAAQTQKTLTVVIKFKDAAVHDFSYHSSKF